MRYTEKEWQNLSERDSGLDWWDDPREVIVKWGDPSETPSETIERLNDEVMRYARKAGEMEHERNQLAEQLAALKKAAATLLGSL